MLTHWVVIVLNGNVPCHLQQCKCPDQVLWAPHVLVMTTNIGKPPVKESAVEPQGSFGRPIFASVTLLNGDDYVTSSKIVDRLTVALFPSKCTYEDFVFIQLCNDPTPMHFNTGFVKVHSPLFSAALQNRITAALCPSHCTYEDLLFIQVCIDPTPMHFNTGFRKMHSPPFNAALQNRLIVGIVSQQMHL